MAPIGALVLIMVWITLFFFIRNEHEGYNSPFVKVTEKIIGVSMDIVSFPARLLGGGCPDTEVYDFKQDITNREQAVSAFKQYFKENEIGYYSSFNETFFHQEGSDYGYMLFTLKGDGKLIREGYCK